MDHIATKLAAVQSRLSSGCAETAQHGGTARNNGLPTNRGSSTSIRRTEKIWARMAEIYGHKWASHYGSEPSQAWAAGLSELTGEQLAAGFRWCIAGRSDPWPPSLPEFRHACLTHGREGLPEEQAYRLGMAYASAVQYSRKIPPTPALVAETCRRATCAALISVSSERSEKLFGYHYAIVLVEAASGASFADIPIQAIEHDVQTASEPELDHWFDVIRDAMKKGGQP